MKNLFQPEALQEIKERMDKLKPTSQRQWGKMNVAQMLAHCNAAMEVAVGDKHLPRLFIGRILGPLVKPNFINEKPFQKNTPTAKEFVFTDEKDFSKEKIKLVDLLQRFSSGGAEKVTTSPHAFFGKLTPEEWSIGMYKHLDHHLRQFGV